MTQASTLARRVDSVRMLALDSFDATMGLLITFGGIGLVVNALIVYIIAVVLGERSQNRGRPEDREAI